MGAKNAVMLRNIKPKLYHELRQRIHKHGDIKTIFEAALELYFKTVPRRKKA